MIKGVKDVYCNVTNMERAVEFYCDVLRMKLLSSTPYWTALEIGAVQVGLHWSEGKAIPEVPSDEHGAHASATCWDHTEYMVLSLQYPHAEQMNPD